MDYGRFSRERLRIVLESINKMFKFEQIIATVSQTGTADAERAVGHADGGEARVPC